MLKSKNYNFEHIEYARVESNNFYKIRRFTSKSQRKKSETPKIILTNLLKLNNKINSFERVLQGYGQSTKLFVVGRVGQQGETPFHNRGLRDATV